MKLNGKGFELEPEMLLEAVKMRARIRFIAISTRPLEKSHFKISDYIKTNNLYDRWIIKNVHGLKINFLKKACLVIFANIGLLLFKWFE